MGYKPKRTIYNLKFDNPDCEGLEVRARATQLGEVMEMNRLLMSFNRVLEGEVPEHEVMGDITKLYTRFAELLIDWNIEDEDGQPVPATVDGLYQQEPGFVNMLLDSWVMAVRGVDAPLDQPSSDGEQSVAESIPMEPLSESLAS